MTRESEAQAIHDARRAADPDHDQSSCWCCCIDCGPFEEDAGRRITDTINSDPAEVERLRKARRDAREGRRHLSLGERPHDPSHCDQGGQPHLGPCVEPSTVERPLNVR